MHRFMVHVLRKDIRAWELVVLNERGRSMNVRGHQARAMNTESMRLGNENDIADYAKWETWYFDDIDTANAVARDFATHVPGSSVLVAECRTVFQTTVNPPVQLSYSEKGLIPA